MKPLFMFGFDRSGTTLLSMMVGAHTEIATPLSTTGMWYELYDSYAKLSGTPESNTDEIIDRILNHPRILLWDQKLSKDEILCSLAGSDYGAIIQSVYQNYALKSSKPYWASMDISTIDNIDLVNKWLPDAKFIHIVRDGRDVALSHKSYIYGAGNIAECAEKWHFRVGRNIKMGAMIDPARYHIVRYEDLIQRPERSLSLICEYIGIEYSSSMLDYSESVKRKVPEDKIFLWPDLDKPPDATKVYRWKNQMSLSERTVFESRASELLEDLGYETLESTPKSVRVNILEFVYFLDRGHRFRRMLNKISFNQLRRTK